jgi:hypothetical protein
MQLTQYMFGELTDAEKVEKARVEQAIITERQRIRDDVYKPKSTTPAPAAAPASSVPPSVTPVAGSVKTNSVTVDGYQFPDQASANKYLEAKKNQKQ